MNLKNTKRKLARISSLLLCAMIAFESSAVAFADETENTASGANQAVTDNYDGYQVTESDGMLIFSSDEETENNSDGTEVSEPTPTPSAEPTEEPSEETGIVFSEAFPDANFREILRNLKTTKDIFSKYGDDDRISEEDISAIAEVTELDFIYYTDRAGEVDVKSIKGIEYFTSLTTLSIPQWDLDELDLDKFTKLTDFTTLADVKAINSVYTYELPSYLPSFDGLEYSDIYGTYITDSIDDLGLNCTYSSDKLENTVNVRIDLQSMITVQPTDIGSTEITVNDDNCYFTGGGVSPEISISYDGKQLTQGNNYVISYENNSKPGKGTAKIKGLGWYSGEITVEFNIRLAVPTVEGMSFDENGNAVFTFSGTLPENSNIVLEYSENEDFSGYKEVSTDSNTLTIENLTPATKYYYRVKAVYGDISSDYSEIYNFTSISHLTTAKLDSDAYSYTGEEIKPNVTVEFEGKSLEENKDYTVTYENNTSIGTAIATVTGIGEYSGTLTLSFAINPSAPEIKSIDNSVAGKLTFNFDSINPKGVKYVVEYSKKSDMSDAKKVSSTDSTIEISATSLADCYYTVYTEYLIDGVAYRSEKSEVTSIFVKGGLTGVTLVNGEQYKYTGEAIKPEIKVYAGKELTYGEDYSVKYTSNHNCGTAYLTVTGKGNYTGTMKVRFVIVPNAPEITKVNNIVDGERLDIYFDHSNGATTRIYYSENPLFVSAKHVDSKDGHVVLTGLKAGKTYYIKAKSYVYYNGNKLVTSETKTYKKYVKRKLSSASVTATSKYTYTGKSIKPNATVTISGKTLTKDTDYKLTYSNNVNVGIATMTVTGSGKYAGRLEYKFYIVPKAATINEAKNSSGTLKVNLTQAKGAKGVYLYYSKDSSFSTYTQKNVTGSSLSVNGLELGTTYYVRARSYVKLDGKTLFGDYGETVKVTATISYNYTNTRLAAQLHEGGYLSSKVIAKLPVGATVKVLDNTHYLVKVEYDGQVGYISKYAIETPHKFNAYASKKLALYSNASNSDRKGTIAKGDSFNVTGTKNGMYKVKLSDGTTGYVNKTYAKLKVRDGSGYSGDSTSTDLVETTVSYLQVRRGPGTNYKAISQITYSGTQLTKLETYGDWTLVRLSDGTTGYCYSEYLRKSSNTDTTGDATGFGIDVSEWNGDINFSAISNKIDFVIIRCGYGGNYTDQDDSQFENNVKKCESLGIPYGVYLYSYATNSTMAKNEAAHVKRLIKKCGSNFKLGIWYDVEEQSQYNLGSEMNNVLNTFADSLSNYRVGLYTSTTYLRNCFNDIRSSIPTWVALWNTDKPVGDRYNTMAMWQYGETYSFPEIPGKVFDANYSYKNLGL